MNQDQNQNPEKADKKTISTKIVCKFCGKEQTVKFELPEGTETPKMVWND